ncbi:MAG: hypothetical protein E7L09_05760 [Enterobacteriaceae bacterium]|nr:hypothetical protein [Enterobacteriaceae bacterium]
MRSEQDYVERFSDFMADAESDGVDAVNILMNFIMGYVEAATEGEEDDIGLIWQLGDKELVISVEPASESNIARLH